MNSGTDEAPEDADVLEDVAAEEREEAEELEEIEPHALVG